MLSFYSESLRKKSSHDLFLSKERMQNNPMEFLKEAAIMHTIDHEHIVRLYGVVLDTNSLMLVSSPLL
jgi:hypothetical protein